MREKRIQKADSRREIFWMCEPDLNHVILLEDVLDFSVMSIYKLLFMRVAVHENKALPQQLHQKRTPPVNPSPPPRDEIR